MSSSPIYIHPHALCETTQIGEGTKIWAFAHVMEDVHIGKNCNIGDHVFIESGVYIGDSVTIKNQVLIWRGVHIEDGVFIGPGVIFTNDLYPRSPRFSKIPEIKERYKKEDSWLSPTYIKQGVSLGAGAVIGCGISIGEYALVGAGAVVVKEVAPHQLVVGNPARPKGWVCWCGHPMQNPSSSLWKCPKCKRTLEVNTKKG